MSLRGYTKVARFGMSQSNKHSAEHSFSQHFADST